MAMPSRQSIVVGFVLLSGVAGLGLAAGRYRGRVVEAGFWFEPIAYESSVLGGAVTRSDLETIEGVARAEVVRAFAGLRVQVSNRRDAHYGVGVASQVGDPRFRAQVEVSGASRAVAGLGGRGQVSFALLAGHAIGYADPATGRGELLSAIGRGIGRAAVHELAHQLLPTVQIHSADIGSYEFDSSARREQYFGPMRWSAAWPMLSSRFGGSDR
jgi:hypothetical protein